jgi:hypothetical protein
MTIATYPYRRPARQFFNVGIFEPLVKLAGIAADVGMGRASHLQAAARKQSSLAIIKPHKLTSFSFHKFDLAEVAPPEELVGGGGLRAAGIAFII